jgi:two-component system, NarL family, nitrate/nitrite response regulator NarL
MRTDAFRCDAAGVEFRALIVDDNERFLEAARSSLSREGINVVGTAMTSAEAIQLAEDLSPNLILVDISLGTESGFELVRQLVERFPELAPGVVLISTRAEDDFADMIATSPAVGFVSKSQLSPKALRDLVAG